jgi:hypothetical protein
MKLTNGFILLKNCEIGLKMFLPVHDIFAPSTNVSTDWRRRKVRRRSERKAETVEASGDRRNGVKWLVRILADFLELILIFNQKSYFNFNNIIT